MSNHVPPSAAEEARRANERWREQRRRDDDATARQLVGGTLRAVPNEPPIDDAPHPVTEAEYNPLDRLHLIDWDHLLDGDRDPEDWLLDAFIARGRSHALIAPAKAGKSLYVLWRLLHAAIGRDPFTDALCDPVRVLYLDWENTEDDVYERVVDMGAKLYGENSRALLRENFLYSLFPELAPLDTPGGAGDLGLIVSKVNPQLVVLDTLSRAVGGDENDSATYRTLYQLVGVPLKRAGIAMVRLDHTGRDGARGARGSSAKSDDVDIAWQLTATDRGGFTLRATHRRMGWCPEAVTLDRATGERLAWTTNGDGWPSGTKAAAELLDRLDIPFSFGRDRARSAIKSGGETPPRNMVLSAAIRWRKQEAERDVLDLTREARDR